MTIAVGRLGPAKSLNGSLLFRITKRCPGDDLVKTVKDALVWLGFLLLIQLYAYLSIEGIMGDEKLHKFRK